jgi:hypothetical protein
MSLHVPGLRRVASAVATGLILTVLFSLFARYEPSDPYHFVYNGLPLPTLVQVIDPIEGSVVALRPDLLGILFDVPFFSAVWVGLTFALKYVQKRLRKR